MANLSRSEPFDPPEWRKRLHGAALSGCLHIAVIALALWRPIFDAPPPRPQGARLIVVQLGETAAAGSPDSQTIDQAALQRKKRQQREGLEDNPDTDKPDPDARPVPRLAVADDPNRAAPPPSAAQGSPDPENSDAADQAVPLDDGAIAMGVRSSGTAGGPDAILAGAISAAIVNQIRACWAQPTGSLPTTPKPLERRLIVATFSEDGSLSSNPTLYVMKNDQQSEVTEPDDIEQSAIDALVRCAPIKLPPALYAYWQQIEVELFPAMPKPQEADHGG